MLSVFLFCVFRVWSGVFCRFFSVLLFLGSLFEKIFGSELLFLGGCVGLVFFGAVLPMFLLYFLLFRSRNCLEKILLMSGLVFLGCLLSALLVVSPTSSLFSFLFSSFFKRDRSGSNRAHPHTHLVFFSFFLSVSPPHSVCSPVLAVRPFFLAFCRGAILGPGRFLDSLGTSLRPFSRTRGGKGVSLLLVLCFVFPRFVLFCGRTLFLEGRAGAYTEPCPGRSEPAPRESDPQGSASRAEGWSPPFPGF